MQIAPEPPTRLKSDGVANQHRRHDGGTEQRHAQHLRIVRRQFNRAEGLLTSGRRAVIERLAAEPDVAALVAVNAEGNRLRIDAVRRIATAVANTRIIATGEARGRKARSRHRGACRGHRGKRHSLCAVSSASGDMRSTGLALMSSRQSVRQPKHRRYPTQQSKAAVMRIQPGTPNLDGHRRQPARRTSSASAGNLQMQRTVEHLIEFAKPTRLVRLRATASFTITAPAFLGNRHAAAKARGLGYPRPTVHSIWPCGSSVGRNTSLLLSSPNADRFIGMKCMFGQAMLISEISGTAASAASPIR